MGIKSWIARRGAVGGTARWAAKGYQSMKSNSLAMSVEDVMLGLVHSRYSAIPNNVAKSTLTSLISEGQVNGLQHLVINILNIEAGFREASMEDRFLFMRVIEEELQAAGVPQEDIFQPRELQ